MSTTLRPQPCPLDQDIAAALQACALALDGDRPILAPLQSVLPQTGQGWSEALRQETEGKRKSPLDRWLAVAQALNIPAGRLERHACLQAFSHSLQGLAELAVADTIKHLFCQAGRQVATTGELTSFVRHCPTFYQLARLATLAWRPAGQLAFGYADFPQSWLLKVHPLALPGMIYQLIDGFGGGGRFIVSHLWGWRTNPYLILPGENERSLWLIAREIAGRPEVRGLMSDAWYLSAEAARVFPHLAWARQFFIDRGAFLVDMGPAPPQSGFLAGSAKRRQLYRQGLFRPLRTLVLWRRADMLAWAEAHPQLGQPRPHAGPMPIAPPIKPAREMNDPRHGDGETTTTNLIDLKKLDFRTLLDRKPKVYISLILLLPAIASGLFSAKLQSWWAFAPGFGAMFCLMWLVQYFFIQGSRKFPPINISEVKHEHSRL